VLEIDGPARNVLAAERTALNILSRMSGIATATSKIASKIPVAATRKSPVGSQLMDKKAIALGGGLTHRLGLWDMTLIKDTHLALVDGDRLKAIDKAVRAAKKPVEVESETLEEALVAARAGADIVMLDNFSPEAAKRAVAELRRINPSIVIELSGGITDATIDAYAATGADFASLGALTHSVKAIDFSMATYSA
jgi:nicotinate-nucleotide pyrophosphorylase (carboxylating)